MSVGRCSIMRSCAMRTVAAGTTVLGTRHPRAGARHARGRLARADHRLTTPDLRAGSPARKSSTPAQGLHHARARLRTASPLAVHARDHRMATAVQLIAAPVAARASLERKTLRSGGREYRHGDLKRGVARLCRRWRRIRPCGGLFGGWSTRWAPLRARWNQGWTFSQLSPLTMMPNRSAQAPCRQDLWLPAARRLRPWVSALRHTQPRPGSPR